MKSASLLKSGFFRLFLCAAIIGNAASAALGQQQAGPGQATSSAPTAAANANPRWFVISRDVVGSTVTTRDTPIRDLGRLRGFAIAWPSDRVSYAIIDIGGFLGLGGESVVVPHSLLHFSGQWDRPTLAVTPDKLVGAPRVRDDNIEALLDDAGWRKSLADYFGITATAGAQTGGPRPVPHGWFTLDQATRGRQAFATNCAVCHGAELAGGAGPALKGSDFLA
jgi:hypothetical protein